MAEDDKMFEFRNGKSVDDLMKDIPDDCKNDKSFLTYMMLLMAFMVPNNQPNIMLEKEVSYMRGRLDTLENMMKK